MEDGEDEERVRQPPEEHGDELQRMERVEHATMDEARSGGGSEEKPAGQEVAMNSASGEHLLGPRDDPGRPTRSRQAPRRLLDYVRAVHAATNDRSPIVLENVEGDSKLTRAPDYEPTPYGLSQTTAIANQIKFGKICECMVNGWIC